jgi:hypothetical protein
MCRHASAYVYTYECLVLQSDFYTRVVCACAHVYIHADMKHALSLHDTVTHNRVSGKT